jgi:hypothetical protein
MGQVAAAKSVGRGASFLFTISSADELLMFWRDVDSGLWQTSRIATDSPSAMLEFSTYTTQVVLRRANGTAFQAEELELSASGTAYVSVNGSFRRLEPDDKVKVRTDQRGSLTIINRVASLETPIFHLTGAFKDVLDINPAAALRSRLKEKVQKGDDLRKARLADGTLLLTGDHTDDELNEAAKGILQLGTIIDSAPASDRAARSRPHAGPPSNRLDASLLPADHCWGIDFNGPRARYLHGPAALLALDVHRATDRTSLLGDDRDISALWAAAATSASEWTAGDLLSEIGNQFLGVGKLVVQGAKLIYEVGGKIYTALLETLEQAYQALSTFLREKLGIDLDRIIKWLGFVFDWDDIKRTAQIIQHLLGETVEYGVSEVEKLRGFVKGKFAEVKALLPNYLAAGIPNRDLSPP